MRGTGADRLVVGVQAAGDGGDGQHLSVHPTRPRCAGRGA